MKKILAFVAFTAISCAANASYLYWQVSQSDFDNITNYQNVNAAALIAVDGSNKYAISYAQPGVNNIGVTQGPVRLDGYSSYSFYVELYNYNDGNYSVLGQGDTWSYTQLNNGGYLMDEPLAVAQAPIWHGTVSGGVTPGGGGGGGYNAPEPTSGLLMLIGMAGLALKRRKV